MPTNSLNVSGIKSGFTWDFQRTTAFGSSTSNAGNFNYSTSLTNGTGAGKCSIFYADEFDIAASGTANIDLAAGVTDVFGNSVSFTKIRLIYIQVVTDTDLVKVGTSVLVGGHASAVTSFFGDASDKIRIRNGGCFQLSAIDATGYAVTATTADMIKIANEDSSAAVTVRIGVVGE